MAAMTKERLDEIDRATERATVSIGYISLDHFNELLSAARESIRYHAALTAILNRAQLSSYGMGADVVKITLHAMREGK